MGLMDRLTGRKDAQLLAPEAKPAAKTSGAAVARADGWANLYTGLGIASRDSSASTAYSERPPLGYAECTWLYRQDWACGRMVSDLAVDAVRAGFRLQAPEDVQDAEKIMQAWEAAGIMAELSDGLLWALVYGGTGVLVYTDDKPTNLDAPLSTPLLPGTYTKIVRVDPVQRLYCVPDLGTVTTDPSSPNYGLPSIYYVTPLLASGGTVLTVHWTRLIRMLGVPVDMQTYLANLSWGDSVYERAFNAVRDHGAGITSTSSIVQRFVQGVLKVSGLGNMLVSDQIQSILNRMRNFNLGLGATGLGLIDADAETFERLGQPVSGLDGLIAALRMELAGALGYPMSRLYGTQAGALSSAEVDEKRWESTVHAWQSATVIPALRRWTEIYLGARGAPDLTGWKIVANPIAPPNAEADAKVRKLQAEIDQLNIQSGILEPSEIRQSRYGGAEFSTDTTLDEAVTRQMLIAQQTPEQQVADDTTPEFP